MADSTSHGPRTPETRYRSPAGTFEPILKSVLEDFTLSNPAFRLAAYLAAKPAGWVISEKQLAYATGWKPNMIRMALRELRKRDLIQDAVVRGPDGVIKGHESHLQRRLIVAGRDQEAENPPGGETSCGPDQPQQANAQVGTSERSHHPQVPPPAGETSPIEKTVEVLREDGEDLSEDGNTLDQLPLIVAVVSPPPPADRGFAAFYEAYPRHVGKAAARKAYVKALASADAATILAGAQRFAADPNLPPKEDARFICHPSTWLNEGRWDDDPLPPRRRSSTRLADARAANARVHAAAGQGQSAMMRHLTAVTGTTRKEIS